MAFCAARGCASLAAAAHGTIGVDSTTNGFVLVLYRALARAGLQRSACTFEPVGGVRQRFEALLAGRIDASILVPPFIDLAVAQGCTVLWRGEELAPEYPGVVAGSPATWLATHRDAATAWVAALREASAWGTDPANREAAIAALVASRHTPEGAARLVRDAVPRLAPSRAGWDETIALRREAGLLPDGVPAFEAVCASLDAGRN
jgi:ABC-type nitrate/sulfonate/bicarbonate transport system substrate-binding protein